jgi:hypothetical protein
MDRHDDSSSARVIAPDEVQVPQQRADDSRNDTKDDTRDDARTEMPDTVRDSGPGPARRDDLPGEYDTADEDLREGLVDDDTATGTATGTATDLPTAADDTTVSGDTRSDTRDDAQLPGDTPGEVGYEMQGHPDPAHADLPDGPLFDLEAGDVQRRWHDLQATFVDDPREAVHRADALLDEVVTALTSALTSRSGTLRDRWKNSETSDTEQLRLALREYRGLVERLLAVADRGVR